jgi:hypothetical protein
LNCPRSRERGWILSREVTVLTHLSSLRAGLVFLALLLAGCARVPDLPPVIGLEGQSMARAAFERILEALESGNQDKVWEGLSTRSQSRIKDKAAERTAEKGKPSPGEKAKALEVLRGIVGRKAKIKDVRGTRSGVEIEFEYAERKSRDLEMVLEDGAWRLNLFSS